MTSKICTSIYITIQLLFLLWRTQGICAKCDTSNSTDCLSKPLVNLCCPPGQVLDRGCRENETFSDVFVEVRSDGAGNDTKYLDLFKEFDTRYGKPCDELSVNTPESYPDDAWILFENGSVWHALDNNILGFNEYCFNPAIQPNTSDIFVRLLTCFESQEALKYSIYPVGMLLSVPFLVATFLVYAILPELRNVHGKSLMCYLAGLFVGYPVLAYIQLNGSTYIESKICISLGLIVYFSFMSAFFWLSVISFDLWWNFRGVKGISKLADRKKFIIYSIYAWGSSLFMISLCLFMDGSSFISDDWSPQFGVGNCFLKKNKMTEFLYLYLPIIIIICFNSTFFILTALKIRKVQMEMSKITAKEDSRRHQTHLDNEKAKFGLFLRLFIIMGVTWCMEAISWAIDPGSWVFYLSDIMNTIQGLLIFILFVMKPKVKQLMIKRWNIWRGQPIPQRSSTATRSSHVTMTSVSAAERSLMTDARD